MKRLSFTFSTTVEFSCPVTEHFFVLRCLPIEARTQRVEAALALEPAVPYAEQRDSFGNRLAVGSIVDAHESFSYRIAGQATIDRSRRPRCAAHPLYRYESSRTRMSDELASLLAESGVPASGDVDAHACRLLSSAVHEALRYEPGSTTVRTTAAEALAKGAGVCQDYAHALIALLRAAGVPARYVSGLTVGEGATHAWVEAHVDGRWIGFDPTRNVDVDDRYLGLAVGRDWADCPIERGTFQGAADQLQTVFMQVEEV